MMQAKKRNIWTNEEVQCLLDLLKEKQNILLSCGKKFKPSTLFDELEPRMQEYGFARDSFQMKVKFKNLKGEYAKTKRHNLQEGVKPIICPFYDDLEKLVDYHHHIIKEEVLLPEELPMNLEQEPPVPSVSNRLEYPGHSTPIGACSSKDEPESLQQMLGEIKTTLRSAIDQLEKDQDNDNEFIDKLLNGQERILAKTTQQLIDGMGYIFKKRRRYSTSSSSTSSDEGRRRKKEYKHKLS